MEGHQIVSVSDTQFDLRELLRVICDGPRRVLLLRWSHIRHEILSLPPHRWYTNESDKGFELFSVLAARARLAHKYQIGSVLSRAVEPLKRIFAASYDDWSKFYSFPDLYGGGIPASRTAENTRVSFNGSDAIEALHLIRTLGEDSMLPAAMFLCSRLSFASMHHGTRRADNTPEYLELHEVEALMSAREKLAAMDIPPIFFEITDPPVSTSCRSKSKCKRDLAAIKIKTLQRYTCSPRQHGSPFRLQADAVFSAFGRPCPLCEEHLKEAITRHHKEVWAQLPEIFGISVRGWKQA